MMINLRQCTVATFAALSLLPAGDVMAAETVDFPDRTVEFWKDISLFRRERTPKNAPTRIDYELWFMADGIVLLERIGSWYHPDGQVRLTVRTEFFNGKEAWIYNHPGEELAVLTERPLQFAEIDEGPMRAFWSPLGKPFGGLSWKTLWAEPIRDPMTLEEKMERAKFVWISDEIFMVNHLHSSGIAPSETSELILSFGGRGIDPDGASIFRFPANAGEIEPPSQVAIMSNSERDHLIVDQEDLIRYEFVVRPPLGSGNRHSTFTLETTSYFEGSDRMTCTRKRIASIPVEGSPLVGLTDLTILAKKGTKIRHQQEDTVSLWEHDAQDAVANSPLPFTIVGLLFPEHAAAIEVELVGEKRGNAPLP